MRTIKIVLIVAALGTASLMWGLSGMGAVYGQSDPVSGLESGDDIKQQGNQSVVSNGSYDASATGASQDSVVGLIIAGTSRITDFAAMAALLPIELNRLGLPYWLAYPVGLIGQAIVGIGIVQFATNRVWK